MKLWVAMVLAITIGLTGCGSKVETKTTDISKETEKTEEVKTANVSDEYLSELEFNSKSNEF